MDSALTSGLATAGVVVLLLIALFSRMAGNARRHERALPSGTEPEATGSPVQGAEPPGTSVADEAQADADAAADAAPAVEIVTMTEPGADDEVISADGYVFLPSAHQVLVLPPLTVEQLAEYEALVDAEWKARGTFAWEQAYAPGQKYAYRLREPYQTLDAGELSAARVVPGPAAAGGWVLETVGRDGGFSEYSFTREDAAQAVVQMLADRSIVPVIDDEVVRPAPSSPEQFDEAKRLRLESEAALDLPSDAEAS